MRARQSVRAAALLLRATTEEEPLHRSRLRIAEEKRQPTLAMESRTAKAKAPGDWASQARRAGGDCINHRELQSLLHFLLLVSSYCTKKQIPSYTFFETLRRPPAAATPTPTPPRLPPPRPRPRLRQHGLDHLLHLPRVPQRLGVEEGVGHGHGRAVVAVRRVDPEGAVPPDGDLEGDVAQGLEDGTVLGEEPVGVGVVVVGGWCGVI